MNMFVIEIFRQKWRLLGVVSLLLLCNVALAAFVSVYQQPVLAGLQGKWSAARRLNAAGGRADSAALYRQGIADLEKLRERIPEKKGFARILSELYEAAASSAVEMGSISYRPQQIKEEPLLSYQLSLSVSGSYAAVKSYLSDLQNHRELLIVDAVSFTNNDMFAENVTMDLKLTLYLREGA